MCVAENLLIIRLLTKKGENNKKISTTKDEDKLRLKWGRKKFNKFTTQAVVRETKKDNRDNHRGSFKCKEFFIVYVWCFFCAGNSSTLPPLKKI